MTIFPGTYVHPREFARHVAYLARRHETTTVGTYLETRENEDRVLLTFDDGTADFAEHALPVLQRHGAEATVFLVTGETINAWDTGIGDVEVPLLTPDQIRAMPGIEFGSHTRTHADLSASVDLEAEIAASRAEVEHLTGRPCRTFCYPYGRTRPEAVESVRRAGYLGAVSTLKGINGPQTDPFRLRRIAVRHDTPLPVLVYKLWRARRYDC